MKDVTMRWGRFLMKVGTNIPHPETLTGKRGGIIRMSGPVSGLIAHIMMGRRSFFLWLWKASA